MFKIAHITNPVKVSEKSDLFVAQPITFETMRVAKEYAKNFVNVELFTTQYPEDNDIIPNYFIQTQDLERSVMDVKSFTKKRKLPLIKDILDRLYETAIDADYFIYTNVDIALQPHFYSSVERFIKQGYDAFVINRRTIPKELNSSSLLQEMYNTEGKFHPGYDCFVFKRAVYKNYKLENACIGANWIGRVLISNLIEFSTNFNIFYQEKLTFHIGDDRSWKTNKNLSFDNFNESELYKILLSFEKKREKDNKPLLNYFLEFIEKRRSDLVAGSIPIHLKKQKQIAKTSLFKRPPIFVVGFPRSGTTYLQSLIATQKIVSFPESHFFASISGKAGMHNSVFLCKDQLEKALVHIQKMMDFFISQKIKDEIYFIFNTRSLIKKNLFELVLIDYLKQKNKDIGSQFWLEKTPNNIRFLKEINIWYPEAKFIVIIRHPLAAINSFYEKLIEYRQPYLQLANQWIQSISSAEVFQKQLPSKIYIVKYENLLISTDDEMKSLFKFLNLPLEISKLKDYNKFTKDLILKDETWKLSNTKYVYKINNDDFLKQMPLRSIIKVQFVLRYMIEKYNYKMYYRIFMSVFSLYMKTKLKIKSKIE